MKKLLAIIVLIVSVATAQTSTLTVAWNAPTGVVTGYGIERSLGSDPTTAVWTEIARVNAPLLQYVDSILQPNTTYQYRIYAYNDGGKSPYSNVAFATTRQAPPGVPGSATVKAPAAFTLNSGQKFIPYMTSLSIQGNRLNFSSSELIAMKSGDSILITAN